MIKCEEKKDAGVHLAKWLHRLDAAKRFSDHRRECLLRPIMAIRRLGGMGIEILQIVKIPQTVSYHIETSSIKAKQPIWVKEELINKLASPMLPLDYSSVCHHLVQTALIILQILSVIIGRLATVSYFSELG